MSKENDNASTCTAYIYIYVYTYIYSQTYNFVINIIYDPSVLLSFMCVEAVRNVTFSNLLSQEVERT